MSWMHTANMTNIMWVASVSIRVRNEDVYSRPDQEFLMYTNC